MAARLNSNYAMACPHCEGRLKVYSSKRETRLVRTVYLRCVELDPARPCGFQGVAQLELMGVLTQSANPHPRVMLPYRPAARIPAAPPAPANDTRNGAVGQAL